MGDNLQSAQSTNGDHSNTGMPITQLNYPGKLTGINLRDKAREFLWKAFVSGVPEDQSAAMDPSQTGMLVADIESALYQQHPLSSSGSLSREYSRQLKSIKFNLADGSNPDFNLKLYVGKITAEAVAKMESKEMASDEKKKQREKDRMESMEACQSDWDLRNIKSKDGQFPCGKCKSNQTKYFQMQTRSSDEPMTTFVSCFNCGHRFKF